MYRTCSTGPNVTTLINMVEVIHTKPKDFVIRVRPKNLEGKNKISMRTASLSLVAVSTAAVICASNF